MQNHSWMPAHPRTLSIPSEEAQTRGFPSGLICIYSSTLTLVFTRCARVLYHIPSPPWWVIKKKKVTDHHGIEPDLWHWRRRSCTQDLQSVVQRDAASHRHAGQQLPSKYQACPSQSNGNSSTSICIRTRSCCASTRASGGAPQVLPKSA